MPTNFPTSVDNFTNPTANDSLNLPSHSAQHANANDAIEAIEVKLGIGSAPASSAVSGAVLQADGSGTTTYSRRLPIAMEANRVNLTATNIGVTFTAGRFTAAPPIVTVTLQGIGFGFASLIINEPTTSGFTIERSAAINAPAHYIAIQMTSASGGG
jgi:hypothetical protein